MRSVGRTTDPEHVIRLIMQAGEGVTLPAGMIEVS